jgi:hypothetical protein
MSGKGCNAVIVRWSVVPKLIVFLLAANTATAQNLRDQHLGQWQTISSARATAFYTVARWEDFVYVIGGVGIDGTSIGPANCVQRFRLIPESGIETFVSYEAPPPISICGRELTAVTYRGAIYVMAGSETDIYRASIQADGRLGPWQTAGHRGAKSVTAAVVLQDYLIVFADGSIERAHINADGSVSGAWELIGTVAASRVVAMTATHIYLVYNGQIAWAPIDAQNARFGAWTVTGGGGSAGAAIVADMLYTWGTGCSERVCPSSAHRHRILPDGSLEQAEPTTGAGGTGRSGALGLALGRWVYSFGGGNWDVNNDYPRAAEGVRRTAVGGPIVTDVNPPSSPEVGGNTIVIDGRNFDSAVTVTPLGLGPLPLQSVSTTRIEALVPANHFIRSGSGQATLSIRNPDRTEWQASHSITETLPRAPQDFRATAGAASVAFNWQAPSAGGPSFDGYEIEIGTSTGSSNVGTFFLGNVTSVHASISPGLYFARLRTRNVVGRSVPTTEVSFVVGGSTDLPAAPVALQASVSFGRVTLQWQRAPGPQPVAGYVVEAGSSPGAFNLAVQNVGDTTTIVVDGVPPGRYYVRVKAFNASGIGSASNEIEVVVTSSIAPPGAPRNLAAILNGSTVTLTWLAPSTGGPVTAYLLEAGTGPGLANLVSQTVGLVTTVSFPGVPTGTYYVRLRASSPGGTSASSNELVLIIVP